MIRLALTLLLVKGSGSTELTPEGYAEILATNSPEKKEEFIETVVTQQLHGYVTSDEGLKNFAATAPASWPLLLSQLNGAPWLCGGATGRLCDNPLTAPLNPQGWASVLRANETARGVFARRIAVERLHAKVTNDQELMDWARTAPDTFDAALAEPAQRWLAPSSKKLSSSAAGRRVRGLGFCDAALDLAYMNAASSRQSVIELVVSAFHDDPGFQWVIGSEQGSAGQYVRYITWIARLVAHVVPAVGGTALGAVSDEALLGVALLLPPGADLEDAGLGKLTGDQGPVGSPPFQPNKATQSKDVLAWATAARRRDRALGRSTGETHRALAPMPHWYLWILGVHPESQGRGVGAALLAEIQTMQDRDRVPCYLETSKWTNVQIYSKKSFKLERDFVVLAKDKKGQIHDRFDLDGGMHAMIRFPNAGIAKL
ncbi:unnamed protein product [Symbiodinium natans]|uniref:N-acetyltransferase domain-containing protein n=1 Tax=Symbiodinium natans TaxID=878477 RepID=A0A812IFM8_9DINO|nr:unnamed protein product [Symbiodinium natans]